MKKQPKKFVTQKPEEGNRLQPQKSPSISRKIPDIAPGFTWIKLATVKTHADVLLISFISGVLLMGIGVVGVGLQSDVAELKRREALHQTLTARQGYWKDIVVRYPDYKDAYFQLAVLSYQLGETDEAKRAIGKVLEIDPNDLTGQEFAKKIRG